LRIKDEFKKSGYFWLPTAPERKIPGTLVITDGGNIELELVELFDESIGGLDALERIIGYIEKNDLVTLDNCSYKYKNFSWRHFQVHLLC
jgi:ApeA N-terminal domain 1